MDPSAAAFGSPHQGAANDDDEQDKQPQCHGDHLHLPQCATRSSGPPEPIRARGEYRSRFIAPADLRRVGGRWLPGSAAIRAVSGTGASRAVQAICRSEPLSSGQPTSHGEPMAVINWDCTTAAGARHWQPCSWVRTSSCRLRTSARTTTSPCTAAARRLAQTPRLRYRPGHACAKRAAAPAARTNAQMPPIRFPGPP